MVKPLAVSLLTSIVVGKDPDCAIAGEVFRPPSIRLDAEYRLKPGPRWITEMWRRDADAPFMPIVQELGQYRRFRGFTSDGTWASKAKNAYVDWFNDCQDPVKLYRACAYFSLLSELDNRTRRSEEFQRMASNLANGWLILRDPPKSYYFVRMGYRWSTGNGFKHRFGGLAKRLLERDPLDRVVFCAAVTELWWERPMPNAKGAVIQDPDKGEPFERMLMQASEKIRKGPDWRPWDCAYLATLHFVRSRRTRQVSDIERAIGFQRQALDALPRDQFAISPLEGQLARLLEFREFLKGSRSSAKKVNGG